MSRFVFSTDTLESRAMMSTIHHLPVHAAQIHHLQTPVRNSSGLPFVTAPAGVAQNAINFTTFRFNQVLGKINALNSNVSDSSLLALSRNLPYGGQDLYPTWNGEITAARAGTITFAQAKINMANELAAYVKAGPESGTFNYLQSGQTFSTDAMLQTNGHV